MDNGNMTVVMNPRVAELADAPVSGVSGLHGRGVQVPFAPHHESRCTGGSAQLGSATGLGISGS